MKYLSTLFLSALVCFGQTQPGWLPNTTTNWFNAGVQGGIPVRSNIFVNLLTTTNRLDVPLPWPVLATTTGTNRFSLEVPTSPTDTWFFVVSVHDQRNGPTNYVPDRFSEAVQHSLLPDGQLTIGRGQ
jgi:hypothetical protein